MKAQFDRLLVTVTRGEGLAVSELFQRRTGWCAQVAAFDGKVFPPAEAPQP